MIKKKGQIVPKWIVRAIEKKSQHVIKFGCDVRIDVSRRHITQLSHGSIIVIPYVTHVLKKKSKKTWKGAEIKDLNMTGLAENE